MKRYYYSQECDDYTRLFRIAIGQPRFPLHQFRQQRIMQSGETPGCPFVGDDSIMQRTYKSAPNAQNGHGKYYQRNLAEVALAYLQEGGTVRCFVMTLRAAGEIVRFKQRAPWCRKTVWSPALAVGGEGCAPDALRGGELGAVPVGDVANALGGQRVAGVAPFSSSLDKAPGVHEALHHLADPALRDAEPEGKVLTRDHWVVGYEVERPLLSRADAEGRRSDARFRSGD